MYEYGSKKPVPREWIHRHRKGAGWLPRLIWADGNDSVLPLK